MRGGEQAQTLKRRLEALLPRLPTFGGEKVEGGVSWDRDGVLVEQEQGFSVAARSK